MYVNVHSEWKLLTNREKHLGQLYPKQMYNVPVFLKIIIKS